MKRVAISPEELKTTLSLVARIASRPELVAHYQDIYDYGFTPASTSAFDGVKSKGVDSDDPMLLTHMNRAKSRAREAAANTSHLAEESRKNLEAMLDALKVMGGPRTAREREEERETKDPFTQLGEGELSQLHAYQDKRRAAE